MLSELYRHDFAISRCGIPLIAELLNICLNDPQPLRLEYALIWLSLLHGLEELEPVLATEPMPLLLTPDQAVTLYAAMHMAGNPAQACPSLHRLLAGAVTQGTEAGTATPWQVMNQVMERAESSPWAELIGQASLLHLSDPSALFGDWLAQLDTFLAARMPFAALLRLSIICRSPEKLPEDWQLKLAEAINAVGDLADAIPLYRFWMVACQVAPGWDFASIRAADLALRFEEFPIAEQLLDRMEPTNIHNPWFYDVQARCRYAYGDLRSAARLWSVALNNMDAFAPEHQVLNHRLLVALRGKFGLGEVSRLSRCGQSESALELLRILILHDPLFANHYTLLALVKNCIKARESSSTGPSLDLQSVELVTERFSSLWQKEEELSAKPSAVSPDQVLASLQQVAVFLDGCEESIFRA